MFGCLLCNRQAKPQAACRTVFQPLSLLFFLCVFASLRRNPSHNRSWAIHFLAATGYYNLTTIRSRIVSSRQLNSDMTTPDPIHGEGTELQSDTARRQAQDLSLRRTQPPTNVPGYETQKLLGVGAFGEVWVALDRNTGRRVAIKFYSRASGLDWSQLSREVEKLVFLSADRYVVQLLDVGWDSDPPYYVMEYIEQGSLDDRLKRDGPMSPVEAVAIVHDVATGLLHAHSKGVLHCDLKPANVLLDEDHKPRIADFGQARLSHEQQSSLGTMFYMAPEQADLKAVPDACWDVYALGALLYTMLTGGPPFRDDETVKTLEKSADLKRRLAQYREMIEQAPRPTEHRKVAGIDPALIEIIARCLAVDPSERFPNVQSVLDALAARDRRRQRRPLMLLGAIGPALLLAVVGLVALVMGRSNRKIALARGAWRVWLGVVCKILA